MPLNIHLAQDAMATSGQTMFTPATPGMNYRGGKLYIFKATRIKVVKVADGPRCWEKRKGDTVFRHVFPPPVISESAFMLALQSSDNQGYVHWTAKVEAEFLSGNIDRSIIEAMSRYKFEHWRMCALAMRANGLDLVCTNPGVAYLVASNNLFAGHCVHPWRRAREMVRWKRTRILESCGFPAKESVVRIMSRIEPATLRYPTLVVLRRLLGVTDSATRKRLGHLPRITPLTLRILGTPSLAKFAVGGLLDELAHAPPHAHNGMSVMFNDVLRMAREMDVPIGRCRGFDDLKRIHDRLVTAYNDTFLMVERAMLPPAPIPEGVASDGFSIEHIDDTAELAKWAIKQNNCLASYHQAAISGEIHFYRITRPEDASLALIRQAGTWQVGQLAGQGNRPVGEATLRWVNTWINYTMNANVGRNSCEAQNLGAPSPSPA
jgi:hypothetical protein